MLHRSTDFSPTEGLHILVTVARAQSALDAPAEGPLLSIYGDLETQDPQTALRLVERLTEASTTLAAALSAEDRPTGKDRHTSSAPGPTPRMVTR